jgi:hypothetical protein
MSENGPYYFSPGEPPGLYRLTLRDTAAGRVIEVTEICDEPRQLISYPADPGRSPEEAAAMAARWLSVLHRHAEVFGPEPIDFS